MGVEHRRVLATALLGGALAGAVVNGTAGAQAGAGDATPLAVMRRESAALNAHDTAGVLAVYADSFRYGPLSDTGAARPSSKAALRAFLVPFFARNPHSTASVIGRLVIGPVVAQHGKLAGTTSGAAYEVLEICEIDRGHIVYELESGNIAAMPAEADAESVATRTTDAYARGDDAMTSRMFADPVMYHIWGDTVVQRKSRAQVLSEFRQMRAANPHMRYEVVARMRVGPFIVDHERFTGLADGTPRDGIDVLEIRDGKIAAEWETP